MKKLTTAWQGRRVVLAGGGTGGHTFPLLAVGQSLRALGAELLWVGDRGVDHLTAQCALTHQIPFREIPTGKWRRYLSWQNFLTPFQLRAGMGTARTILAEYRPAVIFTKGGYASLPTVLAAHQLGIPIVLHESDAVMGWANRVAARVAQKICVTFPPGVALKTDRRVVITGVPIGEQFLPVAPRAGSAQPKVILVTGGSQGAVGLNRLIFAVLPELTSLGRLIHLTGRVSFPEALRCASPRYQPREWVDPNEMAELMGSADLVISRASATTLAELAAVGRPAILIPLPQAANHHQQKNAEVWLAAGAAVIVHEQRPLAAWEIHQQATHFLGDSMLLNQMSQAAHRLAQPQATDRIVAILDQVIRDCSAHQGIRQ